MAIINYAEHCTFIERQIVQHQEVQQMHVETQETGRRGGADRLTDGEFSFDGIPQKDYEWLNVNWSLAEKKSEILVMRDELKEESAKHEDVNKWKADIFHAVLYHRYNSRRLSAIPRYRVARLFFGDLPCMPAEKNWNNFRRWCRTGEKYTY